MANPPQSPLTTAGPFGANAPSVMLPLRFVVAGLLSLLTGMLLLLLRPDALAAYHYNQYVIAITHLFVLGFITTIVMGAMYQLVPVALETKLFSERMARWQFVLHVVGFAGMVWMFWKWDMKQVGHFGFILATGVALFVYNIARTLFRIPRWNVVSAAVASASCWLALAVLAGLIIAAGKASYESVQATSVAWYSPLVKLLSAVPQLTGRFDQIAAMHAHAHLGIVGVFLTLIVGISYKLVPMFTLSDLQSPKRALASVWLLNLALTGSFFTILLRSPLKLAFTTTGTVAVCLYLWELKAIVAARKRRAIDWGVGAFLAGVGMLVPLSLLAIILSVPSLPLTALTGQLENLYGFWGIAGVIALAIMGMLYKILPFLVWYRAYSGQIGLRKVPGLSELYSARIQALGFAVYAAGMLTTSGAILASSTSAARAGCALLLLSLVLLLVNVGKMLLHLAQPAPVVVPEPKPSASSWTPDRTAAIQTPRAT